MEDILYTVSIDELVEAEAAARAEGYPSEIAFADMVAGVIAERRAAENGTIERVKHPGDIAYRYIAKPIVGTVKQFITHEFAEAYLARCARAA